jgi:membrane protein YdbS with pleckstrin-like domain
MLTDDDIGFIEYWNQNRKRKKKVWKQLALGLPLATVLVITIFANIVFRWHKEADKAFKREQASLIIVLVVACLLIVIFIVIFSVRHRWDINEQHFKELMAKKNKQ